MVAGGTELWAESRQPHTSLFSRVSRVGETASSLTWLVISRLHFFRILHMATVFFCLGLFLHCEHKHLFDVPDIKYTVHSPSGQRKQEILAFENSTGKNDKRQSELQTQRMGERERAGTSQG